MRESVAETARAASTCTTTYAAPASTYRSPQSSGRSIIRWTSSGRRVARCRSATIFGPNVRFGTKWPSITSTWTQSAPPRSSAPTASARRVKSALRIDGANFGSEMLASLLVTRPVGWHHSMSPPPPVRLEGENMYRPQNLRIPGPTVVPQAVLAASARPMINHRGPEFAALLAALTRALQDFLRTQGDVLTLTASGSGAMEAAIANTLSSGGKVPVFSCGAFGERFAAICKSYGVDARRVDVPYGRAVEPDLVRDELAKEKGKDAAKAVLITHNETSTGVLNPIKDIAAVVRDSGKLFLVDSVSGAGCADLEIDDWGIDVCITASQKAWGAPPGVAMVTMSPRAWKAYEKSNLPKAYFDLAAYKASLEKAQTPATPAVTVFIALQESLRLMAEEGLEAIIRRHRDLARATRRGLQAVGLQMFADERYASPAVTAFRPPARVDARNLIRILRDDHDTIVAGGQGKMEGQLVRVAHLGFVTLQDIVAFFSALELTLRDLNQPVEPGVAMTAALRAYAESQQQQSSRPAARASSTARPANDAVATRR